MEIGTVVIETEGFFKGSEFTLTGEHAGVHDKWGERRLLNPVPKTIVPTWREPIYVAHATKGAEPSFVAHLLASDYTLHAVCRTPEQVAFVKSEYADWSNGDVLDESAIKISFDGSDWDREWFLIFRYSPEVKYPFAILERGTGGRKRQKNPVAWHKNGRLESCYSAIAEQVIRAGLKARY